MDASNTEGKAFNTKTKIKIVKEGTTDPLVGVTPVALL
jgi:hypothetical protein